MTTIILAAGYGTRLYPLTLNRPKALLEVGARTILDRLIDNIARAGRCEKVYIVTNEKFHQPFEDWSKSRDFSFGVKVINDGTKSNETRLGAIGDIDFVLKKETIEDDLLITGSDNLFDLEIADFVKFGIEKKPFSSMVLVDVKDRKLATRYGICSLDAEGRVIDFAEKPKEPRSTLAATALYFIPQEKLAKVRDYMETDLPKDAPGNLMKWLAAEDGLYGYVLRQTWYDIGDKESLRKADEEFTRKEKK